MTKGGDPDLCGCSPDWEYRTQRFSVVLPGYDTYRYPAAVQDPDLRVGVLAGLRDLQKSAAPPGTGTLTLSGQMRYDTGDFERFTAPAVATGSLLGRLDLRVEVR